MKKVITACLCALLFVSLQSTAQTPAKVSGSVKAGNAKFNGSISVSLLMSIDSSLVKAGVTDEEGKFEITVLKTGTYILSYSAIGFEKKYTNPFTLSEGENKIVAVETLNASTVNLKAVTVSSKKPMIEVKADKTVFNVEASINATGSNALELLQKSPGVQVDNNDNISMKGKTGVRVYIDGKMIQLDTKNLAAYLKSINSNDIEAIEMISNPSAKYDASGNAGIINMRLKKNKKFGTNGSINTGLVQGVTPKGNASLNLNYRD